MRSTAICLLLCAVALVPSVGSAQGDPELNGNTAMNSPMVQGARQLGLTIEPNAFGTRLGAKWIGAPHFSATTSATAPLLRWTVGGFYTVPATTVYLAQLDLEPGVLVPGIACLCDDGHATNDIAFTLVRSDVTIDPDTATDTALAAASSSGTPNIGLVLLDPTDFTFTTLQGSTIQIYTLGAALTPGTSLAGCWVYYTRQVAPGPATATFTDVPTSSPYFKFVEALYASGVVAGCTATTYCPTATVTRGQMAVFLAASLGMGYPW
jgi:hypothetical protein